MACTLTLGRLYGCKEQSGGVKAIYFINRTTGLLDTATFDASNQITAFASALSLFKYEVRGETHNFDEVGEINGDTGGRSVVQTLTASLITQNIATRKELGILMQSSPHIIVEDYNGNFKFGGLENGFDCNITAYGGTAMLDGMGYNLVCTAKETDFAFFVDSTIIGDTTNTTVTVGT